MLILILWVLYEGGRYMLPISSNPKLLRVASWFLLMFVVYGIHLFIVQPSYVPTTYEYTEWYINSFGPIFLFYKYVKEGLLTERRIKTYFCLLFACITAKYFHKVLVSKRDEFTNNTGYELVSLLPVLYFFHNKNFLRYSLWAVSMGLILYSMKRGAIMIGTVCFIWMLYDSIKNASSTKSRYIAIVFSSLLFVGSVFMIQYLYDNSDYFQARVTDTQKGNSSGRDEIYTMLIDHMVESQSWTDLLIGRGAFSTFEHGKAAHQDWLQVAYDNGLLGIVFFIYFCYVFFSTAWNSKYSMPPHLFTSFMMLFVIFFLRTLFSMSLQTISVSMSMLLGYYAYISGDCNDAYTKQHHQVA